MSDVWSFLSGVVPAASGLGGVWLGGWLTSRRERSRDAAQTEKDMTYLAILVVAHLDRLIDRCVAVVSDDGTSYGQPAGEDGIHEITVDSPTFEPLTWDVNWKSLSSTLMYEILSLPYAIEVLNHRISDAAEYDSPPDYAEFFWERRHGYAVLGLKVADLATELRKKAGLPIPIAPSGDWSREEHMSEWKGKLEGWRQKSKAT
jgi:hypothetical protein